MRDETQQGGASWPQLKKPLQISTIVPSFTVDDLQKSITFYEALGFTVDERWEENGKLLGVMLRAGKSQIGLSQDDWKKGRDRKKGIGMRIVHVDDAERRRDCGAGQERGHQAQSEPHDTEWKTRAFEVTDPSGFLLTISSEYRRSRPTPRLPSDMPVDAQTSPAVR